MIIVYIKYRDPMLFAKPDTNIYEEELKFLKPIVARDVGILIKEDEDTIIFGEIHITEDNKELSEWGITFPHYRCVRIISKIDIIERRQYIIKGELE